MQDLLAAGELPGGGRLPLEETAPEDDPHRAGDLAVCKQPDARPDLVVRNVRVEDGSYVGVIFNRGREAAGPFAVDFLLDGTSVGTVEVIGPGAADADHGDDARAGTPCAAGTPLEVVADPRAQVDEADEENNAFSDLV